MRIVHINTSDNDGGAARAAFRLHVGLLAAGHESTMLVGQSVERGRPDVALVRGRTLAERAARFGIREVERIAGLPGHLGWWGRQIVNHPFVRGADVIHLHNLHGGFFPLRILPKLSQKAPLVWSVCDFWLMTGHCVYPSVVGCERWRSGCGKCPSLSEPLAISVDTTALLWRAKRSLYARCRATAVAKSRWGLELISASPLLAGFEKEYIPNGYRTDVFRPIEKTSARQALGLPLEGKALFIGAYDLSGERKGTARLNHVLSEVSRKHPDLTVIAVGRDSRSSLEQHAGYRICRVGFLQNDALLATCYNAADLTLMATLADNSPNVMYESLACGVPVVAFDVGGIPDAVFHLKTGMLVPAGDTDALAAAANRLLEDDLLRSRLGDGARAMMLQDFSLDLQVQRFVSLYERSTRNRAGGISAA